MSEAQIKASQLAPGAATGAALGSDVVVLTGAQAITGAKTFTAPHFTAPVIDSGVLTFSAAASQIVPGATSFSIRNTANSADNLIVTDAGAVTTRSTLVVTAGGMSVNSGAFSVMAGDNNIFTAATSNVATLLIRPFDNANSTATLLAVQNASGGSNVWGVTKAGVVTQASGLTIAAGGLTVTAGNVAIGTALGVGDALTIAIAGATNILQRGIYVNFVGSSAATTEICGVYGYAYTSAASFTVTTLAQFHATNPAKGAGSTITSEYGLLVDSITQGSTNNYGVYISAPGGGATQNIGLYNNGTTELIGSVQIGSSSLPGIQYGLSIIGPQTSVGAVQYGLWVQPTGVASANGDSLFGASIYTPSLGLGGHSGVQIYGLYVSAPSQASLNNYGIYITTPSGASGANNSLYCAGSAVFGVGVGIGQQAPGSGLGVSAPVAISGTLSVSVGSAATFNGGAVVYGNLQVASGLPAFTASAKYVVIDASGFMRVSALGPAS